MAAKKEFGARFGKDTWDKYVTIKNKKRTETVKYLASVAEEERVKILDEAKALAATLPPKVEETVEEKKKK
jgi:hypothetical protein